jgi:hypothetical protein
MKKLGSENLPKKEIENIYLKNLLQMFGGKFNSKEIENLYRKNIYLIQKKLISSHRRLTNFSEKLENKYSREKCSEYLAWHILIGSTPIKEKIKFFDFEGEDSIVNFVNKSYNELIKERKEENNR